MGNTKIKIPTEWVEFLPTSTQVEGCNGSIDTEFSIDRGVVSCVVSCVVFYTDVDFSFTKVLPLAVKG